ncbi:hypothetical protein ACV229_26575 [Burkholderia sp. MR1-5-21]
MNNELKWSISVGLAGLMSLVLAHFAILPSVFPHSGMKVYGALILVGAVGLAHLAYERVRNR